VLSILSVLCGRGRLPINRDDRNVDAFREPKFSEWASKRS